MNERTARNDSPYQVVIISAALALMVLPFISTFNELLSAGDLLRSGSFFATVVKALNLDPLLNDWLVPSIVRMVAVLLRPLGVQAAVTSSALYLTGAGRFALVDISWNCIGWQSFILFMVTLVTGLRGPYTAFSKVQCLLLGAVGTFLTNLVRIALVAIVALFYGRGTAILFHDYAGTLLIIIWLVIFWIVAHTGIMERKASTAGRSMAALPR